MSVFGLWAFNRIILYAPVTFNGIYAPDNSVYAQYQD